MRSQSVDAPVSAQLGNGGEKEDGVSMDDGIFKDADQAVARKTSLHIPQRDKSLAMHTHSLEHCPFCPILRKRHARMHVCTYVCMHAAPFSFRSNPPRLFLPPPSQTPVNPPLLPVRPPTASKQPYPLSSSAIYPFPSPPLLNSPLPGKSTYSAPTASAARHSASYTSRAGASTCRRARSAPGARTWRCGRRPLFSACRCACRLARRGT